MLQTSKAVDLVSAQRRPLIRCFSPRLLVDYLLSVYYVLQALGYNREQAIKEPVRTEWFFGWAWATANKYVLKIASALKENEAGVRREERGPQG